MIAPPKLRPGLQPWTLNFHSCSPEFVTLQGHQLTSSHMWGFIWEGKKNSPGVLRCPWSLLEPLEYPGPGGIPSPQPWDWDCLGSSLATGPGTGRWARGKFRNVSLRKAVISRSRMHPTIFRAIGQLEEVDEKLAIRKSFIDCNKNDRFFGRVIISLPKRMTLQ